MSNQIACRWGDNDVYFGPLTFAPDRYRSFTIMLSSGDDEGRRPNLRISVFGGTMLLALPTWAIWPHREKVYPDPRHWDAATVARLGRNWYWDVTEREFGFSISGTGMVGDIAALHVYYGRQTMDSSTQKSKCYFLPWTE